MDGVPNNTTSNVEGVWQYLLVIKPDTVVSNLLIAETHEFAERFGNTSIQSRPHIVLGSFLVPEYLEDTIIKWMHRICSVFKSFPVVLNNYNGIPEHSIYVRIQNPDYFRDLAGQLQVIDEFIRSNGCRPLKLTARPRLILAEGLKHDEYERAMPEYSRKLFHESFMAGELLLLKRKNEFDQCRHVNVFRFYPAEAHDYNQVA